MTQALTKNNIVRFLNNLYPKMGISEECIQCVLQMLTPINDLFAGKNETESTTLIQTYFPEELGKYAKSEMIRDLKKVPPEQPQYTIIVYLLEEIVEFSEKAAKERVFKEDYKIGTLIDAGATEDEARDKFRYGKEHDWRYIKSGVVEDLDVVICVYDLYVALVKDKELKQMFNAYLIPEWIVTGNAYNVNHPMLWMNLEKVTELAELTLPGVTYMNEVLESIRNLLFGQVYISGLYPQETAQFLKNIPIPESNEPIPQRRDQIQIFGLILGGLKYKLENRTVVTFVDLVWAINDNIYYPKFSEYLNLDTSTT